MSTNGNGTVAPTPTTDWSVKDLYANLGATTGSGIGTYSFTVSTDVIQNLRSRFRQLADQWKRETGHLSVLTEKVMHPAHREIVKMGDLAVPLILEELEREPDHWFWALFFLTGCQPVPADFRGTIADAAQIWTKWGRQQGLLRHAAERLIWTLSETETNPTRYH